jgi:hypothetical protein
MQTVETRFKKKNLQNHFKSYIAKLIYQEFGNVLYQGQQIYTFVLYQGRQIYTFVLYQGQQIYTFVSISSTNVNLIMNKTLII